MVFSCLPISIRGQTEIAFRWGKSLRISFPLTYFHLSLPSQDHFGSWLARTLKERPPFSYRSLPAQTLLPGGSRTGGHLVPENHKVSFAPARTSLPGSGSLNPRRPKLLHQRRTRCALRSRRPCARRLGGPDLQGRGRFWQTKPRKSLNCCRKSTHPEVKSVKPTSAESISRLYQESRGQNPRSRKDFVNENPPLV